MRIKKTIALALGLGLTSTAHLQTVGDVVSGHLVIHDPSNLSVYSKLPLPPGNWEVVYSESRKSNGGRDADMRDVRLFLIENGAITQAVEVMVKVDGSRSNWLDEPCKVAPILAKNDFGTAFYKQKCLTLSPSRFLQGSSPDVQEALGNLARRGIKNEFNALTLVYTRYGDYGHYLKVMNHFFPSVYGQENPSIAVMNESPWHPVRIDLSADRKALAEALFAYGERIADHYDKAYFRETSSPLPRFDGKSPE